MHLLPLRNVTALYNGWSSNGDLVLSTSFGAQDTFFVKEAWRLRWVAGTCSRQSSVLHVALRQVPIEGLKEALQLLVEGPRKGNGALTRSRIYAPTGTFSVLRMKIPSAAEEKGLLWAQESRKDRHTFMQSCSARRNTPVLDTRKAGFRRKGRRESWSSSRMVPWPAAVHAVM